MERSTDPLLTIDAKLWADEFMATKQRLGDAEFDHAMMLGWFANAIMRGYDEGKRLGAADAQATIAALQARVQELEQWVQDQSTANLETMRHMDEMQSRAMDAESQLTQRTAELEAIEKILDIDSGKTTVEKVRDLHHSFKQVWESYQDASNEMFKAQAELERVSLLSSHNERRFEEVDKKYKELRTLIAALPKVEGEINERFCTGSYYSSPHDYRSHVTFETALVALLKHRQGMEG